jgi:hypothetical protein
MRQVSNVARALLQQLAERWVARGRIFGSVFLDRAFDELLRKLEATAEPAVIPHIIPYLYSSPAHTADVVSDVVNALRSHLVPDDLRWLSEAARKSWRVSGRGDWRGRLHPGILSFHPDGFVREAAVKELADSRDGSELPYLLLRLNDWVREVREAAQHAVSARIHGDYVSHFARNFSLVNRLSVVQRGDHGLVHDQLSDLLAAQPARAAVLDAMKSGSRDTARAIFRFLAEHVPPDEARSVLDAGLSAADPVIRLSAARMVARTMVPADARLAFLRLVEDSSAAVRREALMTLARSFPDELNVEAALLDSNASVRDTARFLLKDRGLDYADVYRRAVSTTTTTRRLAGAIAGLAEVGRKSDANKVATYLSHPSARVRGAALKSVMRLDGEAFVDRVVTMVEESVRSVSSAACNVLLPHATTVGMDRLSAIFQSSAVQHVRCNVLRLMTALPKWQSITCIVRATSADDSTVASRALAYADQWNARYNQRQTPPSKREIDDLVVALADSSLEESAFKEIRFALQSFLTT